MRIGTWNMDGRGTARHVAFLEALACDVLLLTEVPHQLDLGPMVRSGPMGAKKDWAAVWTRELASEVPVSHAWSGAAEGDGLLFVSSVLPWRGAGVHWKGPEKTTAARTAKALSEIEPLLAGWDGPVVFGGDFNHALQGGESAGSLEGRAAIRDLLDRLELKAPTAGLSHRVGGAFSIDHIAVPTRWGVTAAQRVVATDGEQRRLSDHDAYVVRVQAKLSEVAWQVGARGKTELAGMDPKRAAADASMGTLEEWAGSLGDAGVRADGERYFPSRQVARIMRKAHSGGRLFGELPPGSFVIEASAVSIHRGKLRAREIRAAQIAEAHLPPAEKGSMLSQPVIRAADVGADLEAAGSSCCYLRPDAVPGNAVTEPGDVLVAVCDDDEIAVSVDRRGGRPYGAEVTGCVRSTARCLLGAWSAFCSPICNRKACGRRLQPRHIMVPFFSAEHAARIDELLEALNAYETRARRIVDRLALVRESVRDVALHSSVFSGRR